MIRRALPFAVAGLLGLGALQAQAHSCVGFGDLAGESPFCPSVSWLKNRQITAGCGTSLYCPNDAVTRLQMAAFLQRMGDTLTPTLLSSSGSAAGAISIAGEGVITASLSPGDAVAYSRRVHVTYICSVTVTGAVVVGLDVPISTDGGTTWSLVNGPKANATTMRANASAPGQQIVLAVHGERIVPANTTEHVAAKVRSLGGAGDASEVSCSGQGIAVQMPDPPPP